MSNLNVKLLKNVESKTKIYLAIIAIILIALCINNIAYIIPSIIGYALIIIYTIWVYKRRKSEISNYITDLTINVDSAAKNTLINSPFPIIILETDGNVIWRSSKFNKEFANVGINSYIDDIAKEIKMDIENQDMTQIDKQISIEDKIYHVIGNFVKIKQKSTKKTSKYMIILYFVDVTEKQEILKKYEQSKLCVGIIMVDNYEEVIQRVQPEETPQIMAKIEKELYDWANDVQGIMIKKERDTFVFIFEQKFLDKMKEEKFAILDKIKEIRNEENLQITLSIAISEEGDNNLEKYQSVKAVVDIALGRGGDQAIIKQNGKYYFFGGRTQEVEKRTRVKARIVSQALEEIMNGASNIIIMGHANSDIDAMGASLGLYRIAKNIGKEVYIVNETNGTSLENFMNEIKEIDEYKNIIVDRSTVSNKINQESLLIVVDTDKKNYVEAPELLTKTEKIAVIDHHRRGTDYIENAILTFHEVYASSTCELVTELVEYAEKTIKLEKIEVEALYAGIMMDTKNFTFKTGVRTFEAAAFLRKCGVDIIRVKKWFQSNLETYNKISEIVAKAEIMDETIAISVYDKEDTDANITCAKAADELLTISNITASFVIGKLGEKVCISGRSIGDINVQLILEKLGGGGHITVAGAQLEGMTLEEVKQELTNRINEYFTEVS